MARQYNNFCDVLNKNNLNVLTSVKEFIDNKTLSYVCDKKHITVIKNTSFVNKISLFNKKKIHSLCSECERFEDLYNKIKEKNGHILLELYKDRKILYQCVTCGNENNNYYPNLLKDTATQYCVKCQNNNRKNNIEILREKMKDMGLELISYDNNKSVIVKCICGNPWSTNLMDIKRGKNCMKCKERKTIKTNIEKYGVNNVYQSEFIKEKIKQTNNERHGVDYPQQNKEIRTKTENTCLEKYGTKWAFTQEYVYEKIRKTHFELHGVNYPLMSKKIQDKITKVFLEKYNVKRPFLMSEIREKCKQTMLERYGNKVFLQSNTGKKLMMEKYGVEHAMQYPQFFYKMCKSNFRKKKYIFPISKRECFLMGYEPQAVDFIISNNLVDEKDIFTESNVPTFWYTYQDKKRLYYPDLFIKSKNIIVEVKSVYTYNIDPEKNYEKFCQVAKNGYILHVMIFANKKTLADIWIFEPETAPRSINNKDTVFTDKIYAENVNELEDNLFYTALTDEYEESMDELIFQEEN